MGQRIKTLREARGLSQQQLADLLGISRGLVTQWETDAIANPKIPTFLKLCEVLVTDPHFLAFGPKRAPADATSEADRKVKNLK